MSMKKRFISILAVVTILATSSRLALAQTTDPVAVVQASIDALNRGDVEAGMVVFADDATLNTATGSSTGKEQIRRKVEADIAARVQVNASNFQVAGDQVTYTLVTTSDQFRSMGIDAIDGTATVTVQGGKIKMFTATPSPESRARIQ